MRSQAHRHAGARARVERDMFLYDYGFPSEHFKLPQPSVGTKDNIIMMIIMMMCIIMIIIISSSIIMNS